MFFFTVLFYVLYYYLRYSYWSSGWFAKLNVETFDRWMASVCRPLVVGLGLRQALVQRPRLAIMAAGLLPGRVALLTLRDEASLKVVEGRNDACPNVTALHKGVQKPGPHHLLLFIVIATPPPPFPLVPILFQKVISSYILGSSTASVVMSLTTIIQVQVCTHFSQKRRT